MRPIAQGIEQQQIEHRTERHVRHSVVDPICAQDIRIENFMVSAGTTPIVKFSKLCDNSLTYILESNLGCLYSFMYKLVTRATPVKETQAPTIHVRQFLTNIPFLPLRVLNYLGQRMKIQSGESTSRKHGPSSGQLTQWRPTVGYF